MKFSIQESGICKLSIRTTATSIFWKLKLFLPLLLLAACTGAPKDDGTSLPPPLYQQPQTIPANPEGGYALNPATGDSIQPLVNSLGDTLITGLPVPAQGKRIHPDSVAKPKVVKAPTLSCLVRHIGQTNRYKIPENLPTFPVDESKLTKKTVPPIAKGDTTHYIINRMGQKVPTGVPIPAKGKKVPSKYPQPTHALPLEMKDAAIANIQYLDVEQGMASSFVGPIVEDKNGNLWFGTNIGGVSKYDGKSFTHFTKKEGLSHYRVGSIIEDKNGHLWFSTFGGGVNKMEKDVYQASPHPLVVQLRHLYLNEALPNYRNPSDSSIQAIQFDSVQAFENYPIHPKIPSDQNHLSFQFSAIDWSAPTKIKYSFRLLGLDNKWSNPAEKTLADYRNLPDGKFTFQVRAIGESGKWSKAFEYSFTILPPWWKTGWAFTLYALLFLAALRTFSLWRERRLRQEKEQLQQKVEERTLELKKSLADLKSTQAQLIQSEKLASLGELTAGIAHEIQNPLNFVNNFAEVSAEMLVEMDAELDKGDVQEAKAISADLQQNLSKIHHHGQRASSIVKGMLEHSRTSSGVKEPTDINALADEYLRLAYHGLRAKDNSFNATMETHFDSDLPLVSVIPQDIGRVLLNLINNAFYVVNEKAKQGIEGYQPTVTISSQKLENAIEITVQDNGNGIPDAIKGKIFQPFFTTKPTGQGTGLGLSLAYDIVTKGHGGNLEVESMERDGTKFTIQLPAKSKS